jgi:hypothetical protein
MSTKTTTAKKHSTVAPSFNHIDIELHIRVTLVNPFSGAHADFTITDCVAFIHSDLVDEKMFPDFDETDALETVEGYETMSDDAWKLLAFDRYCVANNLDRSYVLSYSAKVEKELI